MKGYTPTTWNSGAAPGIDADELNNIETQYDNAVADSAWRGQTDDQSDLTLTDWSAGAVAAASYVTAYEVNSAHRFLGGLLASPSSWFTKIRVTLDGAAAVEYTTQIYISGDGNGIMLPAFEVNSSLKIEFYNGNPSGTIAAAGQFWRKTW